MEIEMNEFDPKITEFARRIMPELMKELHRAAKHGCVISGATGYHGEAQPRRIAMQNDLDLTRKILESIRDRQDVKPRQVFLQGYDEVLVARHVERLLDDRLVDGSKHVMISQPKTCVMVTDLTTAGHNFLSALESEDVWSRLKSALSPAEIGMLSMRKLAGLAGELAESVIRKKLGLD